MESSNICPPKRPILSANSPGTERGRTVNQLFRIVLQLPHGMLIIMRTIRRCLTEIWISFEYVLLQIFQNWRQFGWVVCSLDARQFDSEKPSPLRVSNSLGLRNLEVLKPTLYLKRCTWLMKHFPRNPRPPTRSAGSWKFSTSWLCFG